MTQLTLGKVTLDVMVGDKAIQIAQLPGDTTKQKLYDLLEGLITITSIQFHHPTMPLFSCFPIKPEIDMPLYIHGSTANISGHDIHPQCLSLLSQRRWKTTTWPTYYTTIEEAEKEATQVLSFFDIPMQRDLVDEDGFTLVTAKNTTTVNKRAYNKTDFYRFQLRDSKKKRLEDLQAKFKQDTIKAQAMSRIDK